ncbi:hypothetical protein BC828DRAFT_376245 [Blastocladiella britannica]|nr:hypothetical protein BC828DRAFT_376245 [Blastocladiella britannica]
MSGTNYAQQPPSDAPFARTVHLFDFDDNILHMPTPIMLFHDDGTPVQVSTGAYAVLKDATARAARSLSSLSVRFPDSLLEFADPEDFGQPPAAVPRFLRDMARALGIGSSNGNGTGTDPRLAQASDLPPEFCTASGADPAAPHPAKGPMWPAFVEALAADPNAVWIITARLHAPMTIHAALQWLHALGAIPAVPALDHIWPVAHPGFPARFQAQFVEVHHRPSLPVLDGPPHSHWSRYKAELIAALLWMFAEPGAPLNVGGVPDVRPVAVKFSDDDAKNVETTLSHLPAVLQAIRAPTFPQLRPLAMQVYATMRTPPPYCVSLPYGMELTSPRHEPFELPIAEALPSVPRSMIEHGVRVNTSNHLKQLEFIGLLASHGIHQVHFTAADLKEPASDPVTVIRYKASAVEPGVLVDDTTLELLPVAGAEETGAQALGVNIRFALNELPRYIGCRALFVSMLAVVPVAGSNVSIYRSEVQGTIVGRDESSVAQSDISLGFLPCFAPDVPAGSDKQGWTLARYVVEMAEYGHVNPRAFAVRDFVRGDAWMVAPPVLHWNGPWQG